MSLKAKLERWLTVGSRRRLMVAACVLGLAGLALMSWSLFDNGWIPVMMAMTVGQVLGTLSFAMLLFVIAIDLRRAEFRPSIPTVAPPDPPKD